MTTPPITDPSQQTITADDPRVAQILALIRAKNQAPVNPDPAQSQAVLPQQPVAQLPVTQPTPQAPPGPQVNELGAQLQPSNELGAALPPSQGGQVPTPPPPPPGPIKSFLQSLVSGLGNSAYTGSQAAFQHLGLPTDYEKQQNALKIGLQQQQQNSLEGLRQSQQDLYSGKVDQLQAQMVPTQIPNDPKYGAFAGATLPQGAATAVMQKMESLQSAKDIATGNNTTALDKANIQYGADSYLRHGFKSLAGRDVEYDKGTGAVIKDYGPSNSIVSGVTVANARAAAQARYRTFDTVDGSGNPVTISGLDALQGGAAHTPYTQAKGVKSDQVGIQQYDQILGRISQNLPVLNDNSQRVAIAHTLAEADKNPGMVQSIITSALQNNALTPAGAQLTADIMQGREFGGVARKYGGNMNGTEGLMNRIMANQASPLNSQQVNSDLIANDQAFTKKAKVVVAGLTAHNAGSKGGPLNVAPAAPAAGGWASQFGGVPVDK